MTLMATMMMLCFNIICEVIARGNFVVFGVVLVSIYNHSTRFSNLICS